MLRRIVWILSLLIIALVAAALIVARLSPGSPATAVLARFLPLAETHDRAARAAMAAHDWPKATRETRAELQVSPVLDQAWLRLAQIDVAEHGRLTPDGIAALEHAYDAAPYDLTAAQNRRRFALQHEVELPEDLRAQVEQETSSGAGHYTSTTP